MVLELELSRDPYHFTSELILLADINILPKYQYWNLLKRSAFISECQILKSPNISVKNLWSGSAGDDCVLSEQVKPIVCKLLPLCPTLEVNNSSHASYFKHFL